MTRATRTVARTKDSSIKKCSTTSNTSSALWVCVCVCVCEKVWMHRWVFNLYYSLFSLEFSSPWGKGYFTFNKHCLMPPPKKPHLTRVRRFFGALVRHLLDLLAFWIKSLFVSPALHLSVLWQAIWAWTQSTFMRIVAEVSFILDKNHRHQCHN